MPPSANTSSQVGLGLMLVSNGGDESASSASSSPRDSFDGAQQLGTHGDPHNTLMTRVASSSSYTSVSSSSSITANAAATRWGLGHLEGSANFDQHNHHQDGQTKMTSSQGTKQVPTSNTSINRVAASSTKAPVSSTTTIHSPAARHRDATLPKLSTVTTASGSTSTPLMIFTGSPNPSLAASPRAMSPGPINRSPSPSQHSTLHIGGSSRPTTPSRPTGFPNVTGSVPMDRASSASKSRDSHGRQQSLTSACPPVTYGIPNDSHVGGAFGSTNNGGGAGTGAFSTGNSPTRNWRIYDWGLASSNSRHSKEKETSSGRSSDDDEDPRAGAKGISALHPPPPRSALLSILNLPSTLLAVFLTPITATVSTGPPHHYSPTLSSSLGPSAGPKSATKRYPLLVRLLTLAYLGFSVVFFGLHVHSWATGSDSASALTRAARMRLPRDALVLGGDPAVDVLAVSGSNTFGLGAGVGHWAHKMAGGVGWRRGADQQELGSEKASMSSSLSEEWGLVRRLGSGRSLGKRTS